MTDNTKNREWFLLRNLTVLSKLSFVTNSFISTDKKLETVIELLSTTLEVEECFVLYSEMDQQKYALINTDKDSSSQKLQQYPEAISLGRQVLHTGQLVNESSTLVLPIVSTNQILGVLILIRPASSKFEELDIELSIVVSNQIATILKELLQARLLEAEKLRHRAVLELGVDGYLELSPEFKITYINAGAIELTGWDNESATGRIYSDVFKLNNKSERDVINQAIVEGRPIYNFQCLVVNREKEDKWISFSFKTLTSEEGKTLGSIITIRDIHTAKLQDEEMRQQIQQLESLQGVINAISGLSNIEEIYRRALLEVANSISFDIGTFHALDNTTQSLSLVVGYKPESDVLQYPATNSEIAGDKLQENTQVEADKYIEQEGSNTFPLHLCQAFSQNEPHIYMGVSGHEPCPIIQKYANLKSWLCVPIKTQDNIYGVMHLMSYVPFAFNRSEVNLSAGISKQIAVAAERAGLFEEIQQLASTDSMTGLYNKREFWDRLEKEMRRAERQRRPISLMMIDLDRLKWFNDSFGHTQGDLMLIKIGRLLQSNCRASDTAFRYGGDELCLLLADTTTEEARVMAERLRISAREIRLDIVSENTVIGAEAMITLSIGIASFPVDALGVEQLFERADAAMFRAKETGKDRVCVFDPEIDTNYRQLKDLEKPYSDTRLDLPKSVKAELETKNRESGDEEASQTYSKAGDFGVTGMEEIDIED